jgi:ATP-dependent RNA/DNA helicase IGHMBP2
MPKARKEGTGGRGVGKSVTATAAVDVTSLQLDAWLELQGRLLEDERTEEIDAAVALLTTGSLSELEARGVVLPRLVVSDVTTGLFGRTIVRLADRFDRLLPSHRFTPGDIVGMRVAGRGGGGSGGGVGGAVSQVSGGDVRGSYDASGVVTMTDDSSVSVALDETNDSVAAAAIDKGNGVAFGDKVRLDRLADDVTYKRLRDVLVAVRRSASSGPAQRLLSLLFQGAPPGGIGTDVSRSTDNGSWAVPQFLHSVPPLRENVLRPGSGATPETSSADWTPFHANLNDSQKAAIGAALRSQDLCLIHGPPGTGKTTTVVEYIRQEVARGRRVLATAPSNVAVDNLLERLVANGAGPGKVRVVRLGHPARVSPSLLAHTLDSALAAASGASLIADARRELAAASADIKKTRDKDRRRELRRDERALRAEVKAREKRLLIEAIVGADVVLTTVTGAASKTLLRAVEAGPPGGLLGRSLFDVCVIDEVAQALEAAAIIPMLLAPRLVAAGDHMQLAPTVTSEAAAAAGLGFTLAERIVRLWGDGSGASGSKAPLCPYPTPTPPVHMLTEQYRMHATISDWASKALYGGRLQAVPSVAAHRLSDLPHVRMPACAEDGGVGAVRVPAAALREARTAAVASARESLAAASDGDARSDSAKRLLDASTAASLLASHTQSTESDAEDIEIDSDALNAPMLLVDTAGCGLWEEDEGQQQSAAGGSQGSRSNTGEADVVVKHVWALIRGCGLHPSDVGVLTPYNAQATLLRALLGAALPGVVVSTVDGFQGQEVEALVISCVRSNAHGTVGFLSDARRMNVAVTRARRHCTIVCDSDTLGSDTFLHNLIEHASTHGEVRAASDYRDGPSRGSISAPPSGSHASKKKAAPDRAIVRYGPDAPLSSTAVKWLSIARAQLKAFASACDNIDVERPSGPSAVRAMMLPGRDTPPFSEVVADVDTNSHIPKLSFPPGALSPLQRALFHRAADALGLPHASLGEAATRALIVTYSPPSARAVRRASIAAQVASGTFTPSSKAVSSSSTDAVAFAAAAGDGDTQAKTDDLHWTHVLGELKLEDEEEDEVSEADALSSEREPSSAKVSMDFASTSAVSVSPPCATVEPHDMSSQYSEPPRVAPVALGGGQTLGAPTKAVGAAAKAPSLLGSLHAERQARAPATKPAVPPIDSEFDTEAAVALAPGKRGGKKSKGKELPASSVGHHIDRDADGAKREFGVRVAPLKPVHKALSGKSGGRGGVAGGEDDDDALLDALVAASGSCPTAGCARSTTTTGAICAHCRLRFCYDHGMPETHGCGDDARAKARGAWLGGGGAAAHSGSQAKAKNKDVLKHALDKKRAEIAAKSKEAGDRT